MVETSENNIRFYSDKLKLPEFVIEDAIRISVEQKHVRSQGTNHSYFDYACIYLAIRLNNIPRTLDDVSRACNLFKRDLSKYYKKILVGSDFKYKVDVQDPLIFLNQIVSRLGRGVTPKTVHETRQALSENAKVCTLVNKHPLSRAGAILNYFARKNNDPTNYEEVALCTGVEPATIFTNCEKFSTLMAKQEDC